MNGITEISNADLRTRTEVDRASVTTKLLGNAETESSRELAAYLGALHQLASEWKLREVVVDLRALEFMNSSCFKTFVGWISSLQDAPVDLQYKVRFLADEKKHWQRRSLDALAGFAMDLIHVEAA